MSKNSTLFENNTLRSIIKWINAIKFYFIFIKKKLFKNVLPAFLFQLEINWLGITELFIA